MSSPKEREDSLWWLTVSPGIWALHFLACYASVALWCARAGRAASLAGVTTSVAGYTSIALVGIIVVGLRSFRRHRRFYETTAHDFDTPEARYGFLGFAGLLLSIMSGVAVVYVALPFLWVDSCR